MISQLSLLSDDEHEDSGFNVGPPGFWTCQSSVVIL